MFTDLSFKYVCIQRTERAVIRVLVQLSPTRVSAAIWSRKNGCIPMPRGRLISGTWQTVQNRRGDTLQFQALCMS